MVLPVSTAPGKDALKDKKGIFKKKKAAKAAEEPPKVVEKPYHDEDGLDDEQPSCIALR
jgi:hypothetical protein